MSWSIGCVGKPEAVVRALQAELEKYPTGGQSRDEFEAVLPHLAGLVQQAEGAGVLVHLSASGHAVVVTGADGIPQRIAGSISVKLEQLYGFVE